MNLKHLNLVASFIFGVIALDHNTSRIPTGDEMGGILEGFSALFCSIVIYGMSLVLSIIFWRTETRNKNAIQVLLSVLCISLIYYSTWEICVYRTPPLTYQEEKELEAKNTNEGYEYYHQIPKLIHGGYWHKPSNKVYLADSLFILNSVKSSLGKSFGQIDSLSMLKIGTFLGYRGSYLIEDSLRTLMLFQTMRL